ncbi:hypothetical protein SAMD00023353_4600930 [Rosellinia necatrix]|uniref:Uncharacterized protein n=1 Tax=Rosellinia necatrix TaxID=77044 RepID=A0A1W2TPK9_ROSNE|nr:hypothetical protein SAMD00023353_4600930 [Rosellinia necatrix]
MKSLGVPFDPNELAHPSEAIDRLCSFAAEIPQDALSQFGEYGSSLLHFASTQLPSYDALVSNCIATGAEAASITSYIRHIVTQTEPLCPAVTRPPTGGNGSNNGTVTITSPPTPLPTSSYPAQTSTSASPIPTAAASRPTGVFLGAGVVAGLLGAAALL